MKRLVVSVVLLAAANVFAATLSVVPVSTSVGVNGVASVDLVFEDGYVGDFDITIGWDGSIVSLVGGSFGTQLGGPMDSLQGGLVPAGDALSTFEVSLLSVADLIALQPGGMATLLTLDFKGLAVGVSPVEITITALGDENGLPYTDVVVNNGEIRVTGIVIPEPGSWLLAGSALSLLLLRRLRVCGR
jgi:hypothetical protein